MQQENTNGGTPMEKNAVFFLALAAAMLATPLILFAIAWARDSVFLVDSSGALFGIDAVLVYWMYDELHGAREPKPVRIKPRDNRR
jgi:hypothetical protein